MRRTHPLIIGGGPAGAAAAITLARAGLRPELIERTTGEHDVVCGGFLGADALIAMRRLGVDPDVLGARPIDRLRLAAAGKTIDVELPIAAAGLSRRRLDAALLEIAVRAGAVVMRGRTVRAGDAETLRVRLDDGAELSADALFLATGKHELRGLARSVGHRRTEPAVGLRSALPASDARERALAGVIELHLFDEGYAGLLQQEDGLTNLCLSVSRRRLAAAGGIEAMWAEVAGEAPLLAERVGGDPPQEWEAIAGVPYGWRAIETQPGLFRIGDQGAVIASLVGDGIAISLSSGTAAAEAFLAGGSAAAAAWQRRFSRKSRLPLAVGETLRRAAERRALREPLMHLLGFTPGLARLAVRLTRIDLADPGDASEALASELSN